jgi:hypothetical protein
MKVLEQKFPIILFNSGNTQYTTIPAGSDLPKALMVQMYPEA